VFNNKNFYPTPPALISKMVCKIKGQPKRALEPSAGKGDLIEGLCNSFRFSHYNKPEFSAIEIDPVLQATLRGKGVNLVDTDFLTYAGPDKYDLIIANPPFDDGEKHLLKAIEIMYRGQIVFLLNAETIRNPHTHTRQLLTQKLAELGAEIEYIKNAFLTAERKTPVEVALISVTIDRKVEDDLFAGADETRYREAHTVSDKHEVSTGKTITELVAEYNQVVQVGQETIIGYYRNYRKIGKYLGLNTEAKNRDYNSKDLTGMMQDTLNNILRSIRTDFWRRTLDLKEVTNRLTAKKREEFEHQLQSRCHMDFTENNIRQFVLNLIGGYEQTLTEAVLDIFDMFTVRHCWDDGLFQKNIHYFNGWKTNKSFKVGKRVVIPIRASYGSPFIGWSGWALDYRAAETLNDIDKVMNYFDGMNGYVSISEALTKAFASGEHSGIESTYFRVIAHKKGTIHLTFLNDDILRRFNVVACRGKGWLPQDYGSKPFAQLTHEEQSVVEGFDGEKVYSRNLNATLFHIADFTGHQIAYQGG
jgi:hypothetical protein